ncbi:histone-lysine N-methyltransferase [Elysia marginata]|uniref:Histone-lysine N-methyltransferase n=1 Tax=Elysia marginata TaxID=1093978 RepID=A0AAV4HQH0_9GAST|nr:histone-lysine N-methyltransferase [Elysia marginata]
MDSEKKMPESVPAPVVHSLPHLPTMGRSMRTVQSKSSAKMRPNCGGQEETVLHIEGTSKVLTISNEGISQLTEIKTKETEECFAPIETSVSDKDPSSIEMASTPNESSNLKRKSNCRSGKDAFVSQETDVLAAECNGEENADKKGTLFSKASYFQKRKKAERGNKPVCSKKQCSDANESKSKYSENSLHTEVRSDNNFLSTEALQKSSEVLVKNKSSDKEINGSAPNLPRQVLIFPGEVPSQEQIEKMKAGCTEASLLQHPVALVEGDMKWGKVTGHPYWPCMISKCPFSKLFTRVKGDTRSVRLYHVQFFGDECERGWIAEPSLIEFKGKSDFNQKAMESLQKPLKKGQTSYNPFNVKENRQDAWDAAVDEAEHAAQLSLEDRKLQYAFNYCFVDKTKKGKKYSEKVIDTSDKTSPGKVRGRKRKISENGTDSVEPNSKRQKPMLTSPNPSSPSKKSVYMPFQAYFSNHSAEASKQHPDWDSETLRIFLRKQWKAERGILDSPIAIKNSQNGLNLSPKSSYGPGPLRKGLPFQLYFTLHSSVARDEHPDWDSETLRIFLRKQWKLGRMIESPSNPSSGKSLQPLIDSTPKKESTESLGNTVAAKPPLDIFIKSTQDPVLTEEKKSITELGLPASNKGLDKEKVSRKVHQGTETATIVQAQAKKEDFSPLPKRKRTPRVSGKDQPISVPSPLNNGLTDDVAEREMAAWKAKAILARKSSQDSDSSSESKGRKEDEQYELEIFKLMSTCKIEKDKVCGICEKGGQLIECTGSCGQHFHPACVHLADKPEQTFMCAECVSGIHTCFSCKQADSSTVKCSISVCGKYYHEACVKKHRLTRFDAKGFVCPMHACATCAVDDIKNPKAFKGRYYRCIRCPVSYHVGDHCIPAGSVIVAGSYIICADHFRPNKTLSCHSRLNITWCFTCSRGGTLICCEGCPAAYHAECVKMDKEPDEAWYCEECEAGRRPLYGTIVWIKVGNYRWWPGEICHPRNVPKNIQEKSHKIGEFPVRFFGSHDYYWIHRGRVFLFQEGDKASRDSSAKGLFKTYVKGVQEATEAFKMWTAFKDKKDVQEQERKDKKPPAFKFIKGNIPIGNVHIAKADLSEIPICECKPGQEDACKSDCLNRMMLYECHPATCPVGDKCNNQRFQRRLYVDVEPCKCENRGWGLRCNEDIKKGQFVIEYVGDLIDEEECKRRIEQAHDDNITNFYMLTLDKNRANGKLGCWLMKNEIREIGGKHGYALVCSD